MKSQTYLSRTELAKRLNKSTKTIARWQQKWRDCVWVSALCAVFSSQKGEGGVVHLQQIVSNGKKLPTLAMGVGFVLGDGDARLCRVVVWTKF